MALKISKKSIPYIFSILIVFGSCYFTSLWSSVLMPGMGKRIYLTIFAAVLLCWLSLPGCSKGLPMMANILLMAMISIVLYGWITVQDPAIEGYVNIIIVYFLMMVIMKNERWLYYFWRLAFLMSLFYIVTTIWLSVDKASLFKLFADNLYPNESRFSYWVSQGFCFGVTDHYSTNGMALANSTIVLCALAITNGKKNKKYLIFLLLSFMALFLTGKRAHLVFTFIAIMITIYLYKYYDKQRDLKYMVMLIGALLVFSLAYCFIPQVANVINRFSNTSSDENMLLRYSFWTAALDAFSRNSLTGVGWFGFRNKVAPTIGYTGHCHNIYIQLLCETGIVGITVFVVWFIYSLYSSIRLILYVSKNRKIVPQWYQILSIYSIAYQIYFLLYGLTGNPLYDAYVYPMYMVACTIGIYYNKRKEYIIQALI